MMISKILSNNGSILMSLNPKPLVTVLTSQVSINFIKSSVISVSTMARRVYAEVHSEYSS